MMHRFLYIVFTLMLFGSSKAFALVNYVAPNAQTGLVSAVTLSTAGNDLWIIDPHDWLIFSYGAEISELSSIGVTCILENGACGSFPPGSITSYDNQQSLGFFNVIVHSTEIWVSWGDLGMVFGPSDTLTISGVRCNLAASPAIAASGEVTVDIRQYRQQFNDLFVIGSTQVAAVADPIKLRRQTAPAYISSQGVISGEGTTIIRVSEVGQSTNGFETQSDGSAGDATQLLVSIQGMPEGILLTNAVIGPATSPTVSAAVSTQAVFPQSGPAITIPIDLFNQSAGELESIDVILTFGVSEGADGIPDSLVSATVTLGPQASSDTNIPFDQVPGSGVGGDCYLSQFEPPVVVLNTGNAASNSAEFDLAAGSAGTLSTTDSSPATKIGYAALEINYPYATAVISSRENGITVTEAGVPGSSPTTSSRIFIEYRSPASAVPGRADSGAIDVNTGIAVVNTGPDTANVTYTLRGLDGSTLATGHGTMAAGSHFAKFIDEMEDVAADFVMPSDFQTVNQFGTLEIDSDQPLAVIGMRGTTNQRGEFLFTTTPMADLTKPSGNDYLYFPQFADGNGYTTSLILLNTSDGNESGTLQILNDNGLPQTVTQAGGTTDSSFSYSIPSGGAFRFQSDGSSANLNTGWVRVTPDPFSLSPVASGVFSYNPGSMLISETGIAATSATTHARLYVDLSGGHDTGLAIANPNGSASGITIQAFQTDGVTTAGTSPGPLQLAANGNSAQFADELISGLPAGFTGILDISSTLPFAALTVRSLTNERGDFLITTFPIADFNHAAPSPVLFPQIADGGGYTTTFVLLGSTKELDAFLCFYNEAGTPWAF